MLSAAAVAEITAIFIMFASFLASGEVRDSARKSPGDFSRENGKMPLKRLLAYIIFRNARDTNSELSGFFSRIGDNKNRPSRQALFKRLHRLNSEVWLCLGRRLAELFYASMKIVRTLKGYVVLAADSSSMEMPYSEKGAEKYGVHLCNHVKKESEAGKVLVRCGGLYDVVNRLFVDYVMKPFNESEMSIVISQLHEYSKMFARFGRKAILLADRGYVALQLMVIAQALGFKFCFRGKRNTYKMAVKSMKSDDEYVKIKINKTVFSRITDDFAREILGGMISFKVRVVKYRWKNPANGSEELTVYFTNLAPDEFSTEEIISLYNMRWTIEVAYKTLKDILEIERHVSLDPEIAVNMLCGKILYYNMCSIFREQLELLLDKNDQRPGKSGRENKYEYCISAKCLIFQMYNEGLVNCLFEENNISGRIREIIDDLQALLHKLKTPIREDRHYERWGKPVTTSHDYRFKIDGRNHPKVAVIQGVMRTVKP